MQSSWRGLRHVPVVLARLGLLATHTLRRRLHDRNVAAAVSWCTISCSCVRHPPGCVLQVLWGYSHKTHTAYRQQI